LNFDFDFNLLALKIDKKYVKALNRRATAYEAENKIQDALIGIFFLLLLFF